MAEKKILFNIQEKGAQKVKGAMGGVTSSIKSMVMAGASIYTVKKALDATVGAAIKQEQIFRKLKTSIELAGGNYGDLKGEIDSTFASLQAMTEYGDTDSAEALTTLMQLTGDYQKSIKQLPLVLDMAATGLFDMSTASRYVAMALEGNAEALGRYVPQLRATNNEIIKNGTAAEKAEEAMRILNEKFGGTAQKNLDSVTGQMKQMQNYLGDIGEAVGDVALPAINNLLGSVTNLFIKLSETTLETTVRQLREMGMEAQKLAGLEYMVDLESALEKISSSQKDVNNAIRKMGGYLNESQRNALGLYEVNWLLKNNAGDVLKLQRENLFTQENIKKEMEAVFAEASLIAEKGEGATREEKNKLQELINQHNALSTFLKLKIDEENAQKRIKEITRGTKENAEKQKTQTEQTLEIASQWSFLLDGINKKYEKLSGTMDDIAVSTVEIDENMKSVDYTADPLYDDVIKLREAYSGLERLGSSFASTLAQAIIYQQDLKTAMINTLKAVAAEYLSRAAIYAAMFALTGGKFEIVAGDFFKYVFGAKTGGLVPERYADGGAIYGGSGYKDDVPILAQGGEFIMSKNAVSNIGVNNLTAMNEGRPAGKSVVVNVYGDFLGTEDQADKLAQIIERRSRLGFNRIALS